MGFEGMGNVADVDASVARAELEKLRNRLAELLDRNPETLPPETVETARKIITQTSESMASRASVNGSSSKPWSQRVRESIGRMSLRAENLETPVPTPWAQVNDALRGGLWPGLYVLSSGTGMGKTQWAMQCALHAARTFKKEGKGDRVAYVALELGDMDLTARMLGIMASNDDPAKHRVNHPIKWSDLYFGKLPGALTSIIENYQEELENLPLHVETGDAIGWSYEDLKKIGEHVKPKLLILDYSQLVSSPDDRRREELRETIGKVARVSRDMARKHNVAVLALCSVARDKYKVLRGGNDGEASTKDGSELQDPAEFVSMGKESGEIEFTADVVLALIKASIVKEPSKDTSDWHAEAVHKENGNKSACPMFLAIAKGRGFPTGSVRMMFNGSTFSAYTTATKTDSQKSRRGR